MMKTRKIIHIDEEKCDGCGQCVTACAEGAIQVIDGKARLISETYCDGLGACLGECPQNAIHIEERPAEEFSPEAVEEHLKRQNRKQHSPAPKPSFAQSGFHFSCPGSRAQTMQQNHAPASVSERNESESTPSRLTNWPVQLHLMPVEASFYQNAKLLISADCVPFALADFQQRYLAGRTVMIGCPKLDDTGAYLQKLTAIFQQNDIESIDLLHMEVACCFGLVQIVQQAMVRSGKNIPIQLHKIGIQGNVCETRKMEQLVA